MKFEEKVMDILEVPNKYFIVHASSCDLDMSSGLAKILDNSYDLVDGIKRKINWNKNYSHELLGDSILFNKVYTLFVKENSYDKVASENLKSAILTLRDMVEDEGVHFLAFPTICCGNMGMKWSEVKKIIKSAFYDTDVEILICHTDAKNITPTKQDVIDMIEEAIDENSDSEENIKKLYDIIKSFLDMYFTENEKEKSVDLDATVFWGNVNW